MQYSGNVAIRKKFPLQKPKWENTKLTNQVIILGKSIVSQVSSFFPEANYTFD